MIDTESYSSSDEPTRPNRKRRQTSSDSEEKRSRYRKFVTDKYTSGNWTDQDVAHISYLCQDAKGRGLEGFAVNPSARGRNSSRKVRSEYDVKASDLLDRGEVVLVDCPVNNPQTSCREFAKIAFSTAGASDIGSDAFASGPTRPHSDGHGAMGYRVATVAPHCAETRCKTCGRIGNVHGQSQVHTEGHILACIDWGELGKRANNNMGNAI